jgi:Flp pilus assembly protein CpaB
LRRRSNLLVLLGLASFVLGLLAVYLITSDDDDDGGGGDGDTVEVLVAAENLEAGTRGDDVITQGLYRLEEVDAADRQADALTAPSQLSGQLLTLTFAEGEQLRVAGLRAVGGGARAQIPEGFEAVAVTVDFVAGGASTIIPGDRANVFLVVPGTVAPVRVDVENVDPPFAQPRTELLLTNSLVLDVQTSTSPLQVSQASQQQPTAGTSGGSLIVVLAVDTIDAEKVIFATRSEGVSLYLSRVRVDEEGNPANPVESTPGQDFDTILAEEAGAAFRRSNPTP